ncbi:hypothetical protein ACN28S_26280 [Cystobacter fuscus]
MFQLDPENGRPISIAGAQSLLRRSVHIEVRVREVLKAPEGRSIVQDLNLHVEQRKPADGFIADDYGPWSEIDLAAGLELLVFANDLGPGAPIEQALADACGLLVRVPSSQVPFAIEDVRRALAWEQAVGRRILNSAQIQRAIYESRAVSGPLMASFIVGALDGEDFSDPIVEQAHKFLMELVQDPEANERFRLVILAHEINKIAMMEAPPDWFRRCLVKAMIDILQQEEVSLLHESIRQAYLINVVFNAVGQQLISVREVLPSSAERSAFESVLKKRGFTPEQQAQLISWTKVE